ncbi:unnamed protein product, partial [Coregonus sp. 'balchen']
IDTRMAAEGATEGATEKRANLVASKVMWSNRDDIPMSAPEQSHGSDRAGLLKRNASSEDDLALGVEASLYGKQGVRTVQEFLRSSRSSPVLTRWNSLTSAFSAQSAPLSARGINIQVFLDAQKNRMDIENPDVSTEAREKRKRMGMLLRRVSRKTLSQTQIQTQDSQDTNPTPHSPVAHLQQPPAGLPDRRTPLKRARQGLAESICLTPLVEEQGLASEAPESPSVPQQAQEGTLRLEVGKEYQPLTSSGIPTRKKSHGEARESFEMEEIQSFDEGSISGSYMGASDTTASLTWTRAHEGISGGSTDSQITVRGASLDRPSPITPSPPSSPPSTSLDPSSPSLSTCHPRPESPLDRPETTSPTEETPRHQDSPTAHSLLSASPDALEMTNSAFGLRPSLMEKTVTGEDGFSSDCGAPCHKPDSPLRHVIIIMKTDTETEHFTVESKEAVPIVGEENNIAEQSGNVQTETEAVGDQDTDCSGSHEGPLMDSVVLVQMKKETEMKTEVQNSSGSEGPVLGPVAVPEVVDQGSETGSVCQDRSSEDPLLGSDPNLSAELIPASSLSPAEPLSCTGKQVAQRFQRDPQAWLSMSLSTNKPIYRPIDRLTYRPSFNLTFRASVTPISIPSLIPTPISIPSLIPTTISIPSLMPTPISSLSLSFSGSIQLISNPSPFPNPKPFSINPNHNTNTNFILNSKLTISPLLNRSSISNPSPSPGPNPSHPPQRCFQMPSSLPSVSHSAIRSGGVPNTPSPLGLSFESRPLTDLTLRQRRSSFSRKAWSDAEASHFAEHGNTAVAMAKAVMTPETISLPSSCPSPSLSSSNRWLSRDGSRRSGSSQMKSTSLDTGVWQEEEGEEVGDEEEDRRWERALFSGLSCCCSCDNRCSCCSQNNRLKPSSASAFPYSLDELEGMMRCMRKFRCVLTDIEEQLSENQASVYSSLSDTDREEVRDILELRRAVKQEAGELELQLTDLVHRYDDSFKMKMHRLLDEQSHLYTQLRLLPLTPTTTSTPGSASSRSMATQCCLLPWLPLTDMSRPCPSSQATWELESRPTLTDSGSMGQRLKHGSTGTKPDKLDIVGFIQRLKESIRHSVNTDSLE